MHPTHPCTQAISDHYLTTDDDYPTTISRLYEVFKGPCIGHITALFCIRRRCTADESRSTEVVCVKYATQKLEFAMSWALGV